MVDVSRSQLPPLSLLSEPELAFSPEQSGGRDVHPLRGLAHYGPFSSQTFSQFTPTVRIATVGPDRAFKTRGALMASLKQQHSASDRSGYAPDFPGFASVFGVDLASSDKANHIRWPDSIDDLPGRGTLQHRLLAAFEAALSQLSTRHEQFDVVLVHLPEAWLPYTSGDGFDAHDVLKALGAKHGIPTQVVNDRTFSFSNKAQLAWRLSIALYVKAGGIPWKLAPLAGVPADTAYIGLAYALKRVNDETHFVTCCSQVFDMDGGGMQFVAFEAKDPVKDVREARRNPFLSREDMRAVIARSLSIYQQRNGGILPRRMVIHKSNAFKEDEVLGARDALTAVPEVECIEISSRPTWRGVWLVKSSGGTAPTQPARYPVPRGTFVPRSGTSALLWAAGNVPDVSSKSDYYQGGKSIPRPLLLTRHSGSGPLETIAHETLALTKMDWNNDALYDAVPVSIRYSQKLARTISNVQDLPGNSYPYRLFM